ELLRCRRVDRGQVREPFTGTAQVLVFLPPRGRVCGLPLGVETRSDLPLTVSQQPIGGDWPRLAGKPLATAQTRQTLAERGMGVVTVGGPFEQACHELSEIALIGPHLGTHFREWRWRGG